MAQVNFTKEKATITVDLTQNLGDSQSGKSVIIDKVSEKYSHNGKVFGISLTFYELKPKK
ncbi:MAG: hypothetical protein JRI66_11285 [Deltaproteobacteria bacterium]|nr:hypothetical protein [Deltaproteobacteria bacterium]